MSVIWKGAPVSHKVPPMSHEEFKRRAAAGTNRKKYRPRRTNKGQSPRRPRRESVTIATNLRFIAAHATDPTPRKWKTVPQTEVEEAERQRVRWGPSSWTGPGVVGSGVRVTRPGVGPWVLPLVGIRVVPGGPAGRSVSSEGGEFLVTTTRTSRKMARAGSR